MTNNAFESLLVELSETRSTYESLRAADGPLAERASTLSKLHDLRSAIAGLRRAA